MDDRARAIAGRVRCQSLSAKPVPCPNAGNQLSSTAKTVIRMIAATNDGVASPMVSPLVIAPPTTPRRSADTMPSATPNTMISSEP